MSNPRRPLIASTASLLLPGLGQIYNGEVARGIVLLLGVTLPLPVAAWLGLHGPRPALAPLVLAGVLATLVVYGYSVVAAYRSAARLRDGFVPGPWNRGLVYLAVFLFGHVFLLGASAHTIRDSLLEPFKVPTASMLPGIVPGDQFFADKRVGHRGGPKLRRGDIAVFVYPNDRTTMFVKRIIGLPGDRVAIDGTRVTVNGVALDREELHDLGDPSLAGLLADHVAFRELGDGVAYTVIWRKDGRHDPLEVTVPNGQVFVLGDNRDASHDSRQFGTLPLADVTGVARQVWLSVGEHGHIRLGRTGMLLD
jgi:signal peptidase I